MPIIQLPALTLLDIIGADAARVVNNLCTAPVLQLLAGDGYEAFFTDVRGKTLGHGCLYALPNGLRLIGADGQAAAVAAHVDRYTIREDAAPVDRSGETSGVLVDTATLRQTHPQFSPAEPRSPTTLAWSPLDDDLAAYRVPWAADQPPWTAEQTSSQPGPDADEELWLVAGPPAAMSTWLADDRLASTPRLDETHFHRLRVANRFPWYGVDLDDRHLPQELSRDAAAISFTKGCYLGQETVARLDARGQVQKKLVLWRIAAERPPEPNTELTADGRVVGRLTSVVTTDNGGFLALGFARRSHFDRGATASGADGIIAEVV